MSHLLITGATGFLGSSITAKFLAEGWTITVLSRNPDQARKKFSSEVSTCSLSDLTKDPSARFDAVIHLAGASIAGGPWTQKRKGVLWRSRVDSTRTLVAALSHMTVPPPVIVSASGMGYYGYRGDEVVRLEDAPGDDFLGRMAAAWETEVSRAAAFGARVALVRLGMVLGHGGGALAPLSLTTKLGLGVVMGDGRQYWPWIHREDAATMFFKAVTDSSIVGPIHGAAGAPLTQRTFAKTLATVLHRPLLFWAPAFGLRFVLRELSDLFLHGQRVEPDSRFEFRYPTLEAALREAVKP